MNCLFSTCRLALIPGGWSATREFSQKLREARINGRSERADPAISLGRDFWRVTEIFGNSRLPRA